MSKQNLYRENDGHMEAALNVWTGFTPLCLCCQLLGGGEC